jgi:TonB family protein
MDASTRSFHVYGKTASGAGALKGARDAVSTAARRLLILVDGQRTMDELTGMLGRETVDQSMAELESLGHVELLRHFPDAGDGLPEFDVALLDAEPVAQFDPLLPAEPLLLVPDPVMPVVAQGSALPLPQAVASPVPPAAGPPPARPIERRDAQPAAKLVVQPAAQAVAQHFAQQTAQRTAQSTAQSAAQFAALSAARPKVKAVVWRSNRVAPPWVIALLAIAGVIAFGVWLSAREFAATVAPSAPAAAVSAVAPAPSVTPAAAALPEPRGNLALPASPGSTATGAAATAPAAALVPASTRSLHVRNQFTPEIPKAVRDRGITSGHVAVVLHVDPQGNVERVELVSASPPDAYDKDMERVFGNWTFDPLGIPGRMTVDVDIRLPR